MSRLEYVGHGPYYAVPVGARNTSEALYSSDNVGEVIGFIYDHEEEQRSAARRAIGSDLNADDK